MMFQHLMPALGMAKDTQDRKSKLFKPINAYQELTMDMPLNNE